MKKILLCVAIALCASLLVKAEIATEVAWYFYPTSLPDITMPEFGTARDNLLTGITMGGALDTHSRVGMPTGVEIRTSFETGDISTSSSTNLWRGQFSPTARYANQKGNRLYGTILAVAKNGKLTLSRLEYTVRCGIGLLSNQSSLSGQDYSISRRGIIAGPSGNIFGPDHTIVMAGSGTTEVDAIAFIGGRCAALVNNQGDADALNNEIEPSGMFVTFKYSFVASSTLTVSGEMTVMVYRQGQIPESYSRMTPFVGPQGVLFSRVGPTNSVPAVLQSSRVFPPIWVTENSASTEGTSVFLPFMGNQTNDVGYVRLLPQ